MVNHPNRSQCAKKLAATIKRIAAKHEDSWDPNTKTYKISLLDASGMEDQFDHPAYLLLQYAWNDALDWANEQE